MGLELMSCPFCGEIAQAVIEGACKNVNKKFYVECRCGATGSRSGSVQDACAAWNKRCAFTTLPYKKEISGLSLKEACALAKANSDEIEKRQKEERIKEFKETLDSIDFFYEGKQISEEKAMALMKLKSPTVGELYGDNK